MFFRENRSILSRLTLQLALITGMVGLLSTFILYWLSKEHFSNHISLEVQSATEIIIQSINLSDQAAQTVEQDIDQLLYYASVNLAEDLKGKRLEEIGRQELTRLKEKYQVAQISLCVEIDGHIEIIQSSDPGEIGVSSKDWGEDNTWTIALRQLIRTGGADVKEGYKQPSYWVGPVAKSSWEDAYYKYAYFLTTDGKGTPYLIAPYVKDEQIQMVKQRFSPENFIREITQRNQMIKSIAIVNVTPWLEGISKPNEIVPERDNTVLFGRDLMPRAEDRLHLLNLQLDHEAQAFRFKENGVLYEKHFVPLPNQRAMILTRNKQDEQSFFQLALVIIIGAYLFMLCLMCSLSYFMTKRSLQPLSTIREHLKKVSEGNLTEVIRLPEKKSDLDQVAEYINEMTVKMNSLVMQMKARAKQDLQITQQTYQEEFQNLVSSMRSFRHDMNNHFQIVWGHLQLKSYDRAEEYFRQLSHEVRRLDQSIKIAHPTLSVLFFSKSTVAADRKIRFEMDVEPDFTMDYPETDLIRMYGNLMDNAIEATSKLPEEKRWMKIGLHENGEHYRFEVHNTMVPGLLTPQDQERLFEAGFTTKEKGTSSKNHGQGLAIVSDLVKRYNGELQVRIEEEKIVLTILLPVIGR